MSYKIVNADCKVALKSLASNSIDAVVTDPPYNLTSIVKRFGKENSAPAKFGKDGSFARLSKGFMGKEWDGTGIAFNIELWKEILRVLKPGGHLLSFGGTRTYHRMACAIEDAGFEIRDQIQWIYGQGFPKSLNIGKMVDKLQGNEREWISKSPYKASDEAERASAGKCQRGRTSHPDVTKGESEWEGWGTALKPANEPIVLARKPISEKTIAENVLKWGTGGINIDACRIEINGEVVPINKLEEWSGFGQQIEPAYEQEINTKGRFPANVIHDGSEEVASLFPSSKGFSGGGTNGAGYRTKYVGGENKHRVLPAQTFNDNGSASRFFYCAKVSKRERNEGLDNLSNKLYARSGGARNAEKQGKEEYLQNHIGLNRITAEKNNHPTVKPISLMRYLCKLVTPKNGTVLDPFMGSGSTGMACLLEDFEFVGIELEKDYYEIAKVRLQYWKEKNGKDLED